MQASLLPTFAAFFLAGEVFAAGAAFFTTFADDAFFAFGAVLTGAFALTATFFVATMRCLLVQEIRAAQGLRNYSKLLMPLSHGHGAQVPEGVSRNGEASVNCHARCAAQRPSRDQGL